MRSLFSASAWVAAALALVLFGAPGGHARTATITFTSQPDWQAAVGGATMRWTLPAGGHARGTVSDVAGRLVRVLHDGWCQEGDTRTRWDGRDAQGRTCVAGLYFVRLVTGAAAGTRVLTQRLVLAR
jgi:flagellar hook assembly protein FlgD